MVRVAIGTPCGKLAAGFRSAVTPLRLDMPDEPFLTRLANVSNSPLARAAFGDGIGEALGLGVVFD